MIKLSLSSPPPERLKRSWPLWRLKISSSLGLQGEEEFVRQSLTGDIHSGRYITVRGFQETIIGMRLGDVKQMSRRKIPGCVWAVNCDEHDEHNRMRRL